MKTLLTVALTTSLLTVSAAAQGTIVDVAAKNGNFGTLIAAAKAAGLAETLMSKGPFTVFAPTDAAFAKLGKKTIADLLKPENKPQLVEILTYHVVSGKVPAAKVIGMKSAKSVEGRALPIVVKKGKVQVGTANVVATDVMASNGIIHVIDSVLIPPTPNLVEVADAAGSFKTLLAAAGAAGLAETLANGGPFTIFAPTDEAFAKLGKKAIADLLKPENKAKLQSILKNHVVAGKVMSPAAVKLKTATTIGATTLPLAFDGKTLRVGAGTVVKADIEAKNGVIHVIDTVLLPSNQ
jgi:transforming growth factor-beta-induced protein